MSEPVLTESRCDQSLGPLAGTIRRFGYGQWTRIFVSLSFILWGVGFVIFPIVEKPYDWLGLELEFSLPSFGFYFFLAANYFLITSDVEADGEKICWILFRYKWKEIHWANVHCVRVTRIPDFGQGGTVRMFSIRPKQGSRFYFLPSGSILITEKIRNAPALLNMIRDQVAERRISVEGGRL